jgi:hypothetical protein
MVVMAGGGKRKSLKSDYTLVSFIIFLANIYFNLKLPNSWGKILLSLSPPIYR